MKEAYGHCFGVVQTPPEQLASSLPPSTTSFVFVPISSLYRSREPNPACYFRAAFFFAPAVVPRPLLRQECKGACSGYDFFATQWGREVSTRDWGGGERFPGVSCATA